MFSLKHLILLLFHALGIYFYLTGFLTNRTILPNISKQNLPNHFKKAVIVVVDALRFDFVAPSNNTSTYLNKMKWVSSMAAMRDGRSLLSRFVADPPTATAQRIAGIVSGTLPTFIEAASSFDAGQLEQDNFISQVLAADKKVHFYGDDVWLSLFPSLKEKAKKAVGYASFHLFDLDTVDDGIKGHLEALDEEYDLLILHFLGVDHCGHKFGPTHPEMNRKLLEMDAVIRNLADSLDDNTILIMFSDHGMTEDGDHGGISIKEASGVLFAYAKNKQISLLRDFPSHSSHYRPSGDKAMGKEAVDAFASYFASWNELFTKVQKLRNLAISFDGKFDKEQVEEWLSVDLAKKSVITVPQIHLTPTLSLLLGIPIPFNNLGSFVPELLLHFDVTEKVDSSLPLIQVQQLLQKYRLMNLVAINKEALQNAEQIMTYIESYAESTNNSFGFSTEQVDSLKQNYMEAKNSLVDFSLSLDDLSAPEIQKQIELHEEYLLSLLTFQVQVHMHCQSIWTHFDYPRIYFGLGLFVASMAFQFFSFLLKRHISIRQAASIAACLALCFGGLATTSFIRFEDRLIRFLLVSCVILQLCMQRKSLVPYEKKSRPILLLLSDLKQSAVFISSLAIVFIVWLSGFIGSCRDDQWPHCNYFSHRNTPLTSTSSIPLILLGIAVFSVVCLVKLYPRNLSMQRYAFTSTILVSIHSYYTWINDTPFSYTRDLLDPLSMLALFFKDYLAGDVIVFIMIPWIIYISAAIQLFRSKYDKFKIFLILTPVTAIVQRPFGAFFILIISVIQAILANRAFSSDSILFPFYAYLASMQFFFSSGHQVTISSVQWEAAFVGCRSLIFPMAAVLMTLNTFGHVFSVTFTLKTSLHRDLWVFLWCTGTFLSMLFSVLLLRHLMIWSIFAPRLIFQTASFLIASIISLFM